MIRSTKAKRVGPAHCRVQCGSAAMLAETLRADLGAATA